MTTTTYIAVTAGYLAVVGWGAFLITRHDLLTRRHPPTRNEPTDIGQSGD